RRPVPGGPPPEAGRAAPAPRRAYRWPGGVLGPDDRIRSAPGRAEATRPVPASLPPREGDEARARPAPPADARDPERADRPEGFLLPAALAGRGGRPRRRSERWRGGPPVLRQCGDGRARPRGLRTPHVRGDSPQGFSASRTARGGVHAR